MDILNDLTSGIGKRIKIIRQQKSMTQETLGLLTGIDSADISKYESGKINLTLKTIAKFAIALEVHPKELYDFDLDITDYEIEE
jgi:transcriptional regulator with XRE-family HTH domain